MSNSILDIDEAAAAIQAHLVLSTLPAYASTTLTAVASASKAATTSKNNNETATTTSTNSSSNKDSKQVAPYDRWTLRDDASIDYGYLGRTGGAGMETIARPGEDGFYITTAINYTNGPAHIGHAYEAATTDVLARYHRLVGTRPVFFLTGTDEHGQKIANTAAEQNMEPIDLCNKYVTGFQVLNQRLLISNDDFLRTTSARHKLTAQEVWKRCHANGDVYLDTYSGWYNIREETFVTDNDAALSDYKDPTSGQPLKKVQEESYFFRMSKYKDQLLAHIEANPNFIVPPFHRNLIVSRLQADDLRDLSISRTTFAWGIPVPEGFDAKHVMYVWVDALSNYLTGVNGLGVIDTAPPGLEKFWPASVHVIGKDILWFHTVIWPCLLMSAKVPLPHAVFAHGFVNDKDGKKMSKSLGNVVDPHDMLDHFDVDTFRWYMCKEASFGGELNFSPDSMRDMHNADLCNTLGNLVNRATNLCGKFCNGRVPEVPAPTKAPVDWQTVVTTYCDKMNVFDLQGGAMTAIQAFSEVNGYLQTEAPWLKKGDEHAEERQVVVRATLEAIYALTHLLLPFLPVGGRQIFQKLHTEPKALKDLDPSGRNLQVGTEIEVGEVLYERSLSEEEKNNAKEAALKKKESFAEAQRRKKEAQAKNIAKSKEALAAAASATGEDPNQPEFTKMDIRVGKIVKVWTHPEADKLYCEQIDVGEDKPRDIASGLRDFYSLEQMQDRKVLVVCNLKAVKMVGFTSEGMVLAAKSDDGKNVELVEPPSDAPVGERVAIDGLIGEPYSSTQTKKKKTWETVAKELKTGEGGVATWSGMTIQTSVGPCKVASLVGAPIS